MPSVGFLQLQPAKVRLASIITKKLFFMANLRFAIRGLLPAARYTYASVASGLTQALQYRLTTAPKLFQDKTCSWCFPLFLWVVIWDKRRKKPLLPGIPPT